MGLELIYNCGGTTLWSLPSIDLLVVGGCRFYGPNTQQLLFLVAHIGAAAYHAVDRLQRIMRSASLGVQVGMGKHLNSTGGS